MAGQEELERSQEDILTLGEIKGHLSTISTSVSEMNKSMITMGNELSETKTSLRGSWKEVRDLKDQVRQFPDKVREAVKDHEKDCIAREKVRRKAISTNDSDANIPRPDDSQVVQVQPGAPVGYNNGFTISKGLLAVVVVLGALLVGGGIMIGAIMFDSPQDASSAVRKVTDKIVDSR